MTISELLQELGDVKTEGNAYYTAYKNMKGKEELLKQELMAKLDQAGLKSAKGDKYSVSKTLKHDFVLQNEHHVMEWLVSEPDVESDFYIGLKLTPLKTLARQMLKDTGEVIPGLETTTNEVLTVKENKR